MDHGRADDTHRPLPEWMARVLDLLDEHHGGPAGWLTAQGFGDEDLAALRSRLVG